MGERRGWGERITLPLDPGETLKALLAVDPADEGDPAILESTD